MDPELMVALCLCPACLGSEVPGMVRGADGAGTFCGRCDLTGVVLCEDIQDGEEAITLLAQRAGVVVVTAGGEAAQ